MYRRYNENTQVLLRGFPYLLILTHTKIPLLNTCALLNFSTHAHLWRRLLNILYLSTFILILYTVNPFYIDIFNIISHFALFPQTETYDIVHDWRRAVVVDLVATVKQQTTCFFQIHPQSWPINYVEWSLHRRFIDKNTTSQRGISRRLHSRLTSMEWNSLAELQTIGSPL